MNSLTFWRDSAIIFTCGVMVNSFLSLQKATQRFNNHEMCYIAMSPEETLKQNKKLIEYRAQELSLKRCGK